MNRHIKSKSALMVSQKPTPLCVQLACTVCQGRTRTSSKWVDRHIKVASFWSQRSATMTRQKPTPLHIQLACTICGGGHKPPVNGWTETSSLPCSRLKPRSTAMALHRAACAFVSKVPCSNELSGGVPFALISFMRGTRPFLTCS
jgi:ribosomal protein L33